MFSTKSKLFWSLLGSACLATTLLPLLNNASILENFAEFQISPKKEININANTTPIYESHALDSAGRMSVHSVTLVQTPNGDLRAFWYGGSREGARDVSIYSSRYSKESRQWGVSNSVITVELVESHLGRTIKKLGNPSAFLDERGRIWLFFVSVSFGGWSGSSINYTISENNGETFGKIRRLVTSPFLNISSLVRSPAVPMHGGNIALPIYHELFGKFAEILILDSNGRVHDKKRISSGRIAIQPYLLPVGSKDAELYMRNAGPSRQILHVNTKDGGKTFTRPQILNLPSPDSPVAVALLPDGRIAMIFNNSQTGRGVLSIAVKEKDDVHWTIIHDFENSSQSNKRYSYPAVLLDSSHNLHIAYTYERKFIKHVMFNIPWLNKLSKD